MPSGRTPRPGRCRGGLLEPAIVGHLGARGGGGRLEPAAAIERRQGLRASGLELGHAIGRQAAAQGHHVRLDIEAFGRRDGLAGEMVVLGEVVLALLGRGEVEIAGAQPLAEVRTLRRHRPCCVHVRREQVDVVPGIGIDAAVRLDGAAGGHGPAQQHQNGQAWTLLVRAIVPFDIRRGTRGRSGRGCAAWRSCRFGNRRAITRETGRGIKRLVAFAQVLRKLWRKRQLLPRRRAAARPARPSRSRK